MNLCLRVVFVRLLFFARYDRLHLVGQTVKIDEALRVRLVVVALTEGRDLFAVERVRTPDAGVDHVAFVELQLHCAGDVFLRRKR